jgi:hypothetical protein
VSLTNSYIFILVLTTVIKSSLRRFLAVVHMRRIYCFHIMSGPKINYKKGLKTSADVLKTVKVYIF